MHQNYPLSEYTKLSQKPTPTSIYYSSYNNPNAKECSHYAKKSTNHQLTNQKLINSARPHFVSQKQYQNTHMTRSELNNKFDNHWISNHRKEKIGHRLSEYQPNAAEGEKNNHNGATGKDTTTLMTATKANPNVLTVEQIKTLEKQEGENCMNIHRINCSSSKRKLVYHHGSSSNNSSKDSKQGTRQLSNFSSSKQGVRAIINANSTDRYNKYIKNELLNVNIDLRKDAFDTVLQPSHRPQHYHQYTKSYLKSEQCPQNKQRPHYHDLENEQTQKTSNQTFSQLNQQQQRCLLLNDRARSNSITQLHQEQITDDIHREKKQSSKYKVSKEGNLNQKRSDVKPADSEASNRQLTRSKSTLSKYCQIKNSVQQQASSKLQAECHPLEQKAAQKKQKQQPLIKPTSINQQQSIKISEQATKFNPTTIHHQQSHKKDTQNIPQKLKFHNLCHNNTEQKRQRVNSAMTGCYQKGQLEQKKQLSALEIADDNCRTNRLKFESAVQRPSHNKLKIKDHGHYRDPQISKTDYDLKSQKDTIQQQNFDQESAKPILGSRPSNRQQNPSKKPLSSKTYHQFSPVLLGQVDSKKRPIRLTINSARKKP